MAHLVVSISGHDFGHVAQTAPILNQLHQLLPELRLTVRSAVPDAHLRSRIHVPFKHLPSDGDIGMVMSSALDVLVGESRAAYRAFHADWDACFAGEAGLCCTDSVRIWCSPMSVICRWRAFSAPAFPMWRCAR